MFWIIVLALILTLVCQNRLRKEGGDRFYVSGPLWNRKNGYFQRHFRTFLKN